MALGQKQKDFAESRNDFKDFEKKGRYATAEADSSASNIMGHLVEESATLKNLRSPPEYDDAMVKVMSSNNTGRELLEYQNFDRIAPDISRLTDQHFNEDSAERLKQNFELTEQR